MIEQGFDLLRELEGNDSFKKLRDLFMRAVKVTGNYIEELRSHANITENSDEKVSMDFINFHKDKIMQGFSGEGEAGNMTITILNCFKNQNQARC